MVRNGSIPRFLLWLVWWTFNVSLLLLLSKRCPPLLTASHAFYLVTLSASHWKGPFEVSSSLGCCSGSGLRSRTQAAITLPVFFGFWWSKTCSSLRWVDSYLGTFMPRRTDRVRWYCLRRLQSRQTAAGGREAGPSCTPLSCPMALVAVYVFHIGKRF